MGRLSVVVLFTPELARQREFYEKSLGLAPSAAGERWLQFATRDAVLALRPLAAGEVARIELGFDVRSLDERVTALAGRGVPLVGPVEESPECRIGRVTDPEGNVVQLVERRRPTAGGKWPRLSHAIVNAQAFEACAHFYHDVLGFRMAEEREHWIEFDTGDASLTLHAWRDADGLPLAPDQRVSFALMDNDLDAWADELRKRGVRFATSPSEEELGRFAEVEDADGWFVVLRGPSPEVPLEEELAEDYADDDDSRMEQIRRTPDAEPGARPGFGSRKLARKKVERVATKGFDALQRSRESDRGGFSPGARGDRPAGPGGTGGPRGDRPFTPRPAGAGGPGGPRPDRPFTPRPDRPPGAGGPPRGDRPFTPRGDRPAGTGGPSGPRHDRPFTPRPDRPPGVGGPPRGDRPFTPRGDRPPGPRPDRPFTPRSDRPPGAGGPRPPSAPRPDRSSGGPPTPRTPGSAPRGPRRDER
jgi:predicted enzyme related to lactoylglutathione lyase